MSSTDNNISIIIQWLHLTIGNFLGLIGIIGSIGTLLVFSHPKLFQSTCSRYIIVGSIFDLIQIINVGLPELLRHAFQIDVTSKHRILCKVHDFINKSTSLIPYFCLYMLLFDRWTKTSRDVHRRQISTHQFAKKALAIIILFCTLFGAPNLYITDIVRSSTTIQSQVCISTLSAYVKYLTYFVIPVLTLVGPLIIISMFSILTWININKLGGQRIISHLEKQLTLISIFQALTVIISSVPNSIYFFYSTITGSDHRDPSLTTQEDIFQEISRILHCIVYICPFYIYLWLSSEVRQILKQRICRRKNRVAVLMHTVVILTRRDNNV